MPSSQHRQKESRQDSPSRAKPKPTGGEAAPNPVQVQKFLGGLDYPVSKQDILDKAREKGADERVLAALERIPDQQYDSPVAVSREVGQLD